MAVEATPEEIEVRVRWALAQPGGRYQVRLAVRDGWEHLWSERETPLLNAVYFYPEHWAPGEVAEVEYELALPAGIPPADYRLELALYDAVTGARLPVIGGDGDFRGVVFVSDPVAVPPAEQPVEAGAVAFERPQAHGWLDGSLQLIGSPSLPAALPAGERMTVSLVWRGGDALPRGLQVAFELGDEAPTVLPLSRFPGEGWRAGEVIQERYTVAIPPSAAPGPYQLRVAVVGPDGAGLAGGAVELGVIEVEATDRAFQLPDEVSITLGVQVGDLFELHGAQVPLPEVRPGDSLHLTLYWRALRQPDDDYTVFVHLVAPDGTNLAQADRWPANRPTHTWAPGEVVADEVVVEVPFDAPAAHYRLAVGLYQATSGLRLPLVDEDGMPIPDGHLFLPGLIEVVAP
jgi:hypothetical protein